MKRAKSFTAISFLVILAGCLLLVFYSVFCTAREGVLPWYQPGDDEGASYLGVVEWFKDTCKTFCTTKLPGQVEIKEINAYVNRLAGKWIFEDTDPEVIRLDNGYLENMVYYDYANDGSVDQVTDFREYVESLGARYLYVQAPSKICELDPQLPMKGMCNANQQVTWLLGRLGELGVDTLDLRARLHADGYDHYDSFYVTDHHWKMEMGPWVARTIAQELNSRYDLGMDTEILAEGQFTDRVWEGVFLGSWGRKVTLAYAKPEDFVLPVPKNDVSVHLTVPAQDVDCSGGFEILYDESRIVPQDYYDGNSYGAVMMGDTPYMKVVNELRPDGPVVAVLRESFAIAPSPYLAVSAGELHLIDARYYRGSIKELLAEIHPDVVMTLFNVQCNVGAYLSMVG